MGDILLGLPVLEDLARAFPQARIDWLCEEKSAQLLEDHPRIDRLHVFPRRALSYHWARPWRWPRALLELARFFTNLRRYEYDGLLDLQGNLKSSLQVLLARSRRKIGFDRRGSREGAWLAVREQVDPGPARLHRIEKDLRLARALGAPGAYHRPSLGLDGPRRAAAEGFWQKVPGTGPRLVVHPGSSRRNAYKRWPAERYGAVVRRLREETDARVVMIEGPGEEELLHRAAAGGARFTLFPRERSLREAAALIGSAHLFLGGDSAPLHLASLQGIPCVALFGPKSPARFGPFQVPARILRHPTSCHPCRLRTCPVPLCVKGIQPEEVVAAVLDLRAETAAAAGGEAP